MGDIRSLGRIGWRTLGYTIGLSGIAVVLGLVMVDVFKPGAGVDPDLAAELLSEGAERAQAIVRDSQGQASRSEEHTSELQSLMRISYAVFCLKKKNNSSVARYNATYTHSYYPFAQHLPLAHTYNYNVN